MFIKEISGRLINTWTVGTSAYVVVDRLSEARIACHCWPRIITLPISPSESHPARGATEPPVTPDSPFTVNCMCNIKLCSSKVQEFMRV